MEIFNSKAEVLSALYESKEGEIILIDQILRKLLQKNAQKAIDENNKGVLKALLLKETKQLIDREVNGEKEDIMYASIYDELIEYLQDLSHRIDRYADFIDAAPADNTPVSKEENDLIKHRKKESYKIDIYGDDKNKFDVMQPIDKELCKYRKSRAINIMLSDYSMRFQYDKDKFADTYYDADREGFNNELDYSKFTDGLRKLSARIKFYAEAMQQTNR